MRFVGGSVELGLSLASTVQWGGSVPTVIVRDEIFLKEAPCTTWIE